MKAKQNTLLIIVGLLAYLCGLCNASAFYDPATQRWLNRDPIAEKGGVNLYEFVKSDSINYRDSHGLLIDPVDILIHILDEWIHDSDRTKHCKKTSEKKQYTFTDKNGKPLPGSPSQKVCTYSCGDPDDIHTLHDETVYVDSCSDCPSGDSVAEHPPSHAPTIPQPKSK